MKLFNKNEEITEQGALELIQGFWKCSEEYARKCLEEFRGGSRLFVSNNETAFHLIWK